MRMGLEGFDFLAAEKDTSKKIEELASVLENVATIFLNGVGSLEKQLEEIRGRIAKVETQVETLLRVGGTRVAPAVAEDEGVASSAPSPALSTPPTPSGVGSLGPASPPPRTPTSPLGATSGIGIKAQMQGELKSFLARRRAALEARLESEGE